MINWKLLKIFGIVLGILSLVLAFVLFDQSVGYTEGSYSYGGDAYTGIQNAAAQTANNLVYTGELIKLAAGFFLIVQGLAMLLGALCIRPGKAAAAQPVMPVAPVQPMAPMQPMVPVQPVEPAQTFPAQPAPVAQQPDFWVCPTCGKKSPQEFFFCETCGTPKPR